MARPFTPSATEVNDDVKTPTHEPERRRAEGALVVGVRYVLPAVLVVLGIVLWPLDPNGMGPDLFAMLVGSGLSVALVNWLFRLGSQGDDERRAEAEARDYLSRHGHWPDEDPS